mgnify:CR=1 FL=1
MTIRIASLALLSLHGQVTVWKSLSMTTMQSNFKQLATTGAVISAAGEMTDKVIVKLTQYCRRGCSGPPTVFPLIRYNKLSLTGFFADFMNFSIE